MRRVLTPLRLKRLLCVLGLLLASGLVVTLILYALRQNMNLFYTPTQILQNRPSVDLRIRVGGLVKKGSVVRGKNLELTFQLTDLTSAILIEYSGILPDLFREGQGIVAMGQWTSDKFLADEILAKHDENYRPPQINHSLEEQKL